MQRRILLAVLFVAIAGAAIYYLQDKIQKQIFETPVLPSYEGISNNEVEPGENLNKIATVAENLEIPWETVFLPNGELLVSERPGRIQRLKPDGSRTSIDITIAHRGEGGLLGMTLHPNFGDNRWIYIYFTTPEGDALRNRVMRYAYDDGTLTDEKLILGDIPGAIYHDGGRMKFGPDGKLYITTGDATKSDLAQDKNSLAGKILRLNDDGSIPGDNPFGTAIWSYGHRNPQGLVWDDQGRLWSTEHGRSGVLSGYDELNLIEKGKNYGWPVIEGPETKDGMESPVVQSGADITWAPASAVYWNGRIFFGGLRGESLYEADIRTSPPTMREHFHTEFGRIRNVVLSPDENFLFITTSNRDGRGTVNQGDDKIIRIPVSLF